MKRRIVCLILSACMLLAVLALTACGGNNAPEEGLTTRMTVDINPSIEFMIDDQNKVVAVTALNDDGSVLIAGEAFVGKTPEEATELLLSIACETGYLVEGNAAEGTNTVKISVSGDSGYAAQLSDSVRAKASAVLAEFDIQGAVEKVDALNTEALRALAATTSLYTEEELAEMDDEQLYDVIAAGRIETALLLTEDMRKAYYAAKEHEISFAESEEVARVIEGMGGIYAMIHTTYKTALDAYSAAIVNLEEFRYNTLVSPESDYQKSLAALREAKAEMLKQKNYVASLEVNGEEYASATLTLQMSEEQYEAALASYEALGAAANKILESLINRMKQAETALIELEETLFTDDIEAKLQEKASEIETNLNAAKDAFFAEFEETHKADILAMEQALRDQKQVLITNIEGDKVAA